MSLKLLSKIEFVPKEIFKIVKIFKATHLFFLFLMLEQTNVRKRITFL